MDYAASEAIARKFQKEVQSCNNAACFKQRILPHARSAYRAYDEALRQLHPYIQQAIRESCAKVPYPNAALCQATSLENMALTANDAFDNGSIEIEKVSDQATVSALTKFCGGSDDSSCVLNSLRLIERQAGTGIRVLKTAHYHMQAVSILSALCEQGEGAVFSDSAGPRAKPGFGDQACESKELGKAMVPAGPFSYDPDFETKKIALRKNTNRNKEASLPCELKYFEDFVAVLKTRAASEMITSVLSEREYYQSGAYFSKSTYAMKSSVAQVTSTNQGEVSREEKLEAETLLGGSGVEASGDAGK